MKVCVRWGNTPCKLIDQTGRGLNFTEDHIAECCPKITPLTEKVSSYKNVSDLVDDIEMNKDILAEMWSKGLGACMTCHKLKEIPDDQANQFLKYYAQTIQVNHYTTCNSKCTYCEEWKRNKAPLYELFPILEEINKRTDFLHPATHIVWSGGEPSVYPIEDFKNCVNLITDHGFNVTFNTNAIRFSKEIAHALENNPGAQIRCSVDCGNKFSYRKIHGVDKFEAVWDNLERYAQIAGSDKVIVKYIIFDKNKSHSEYREFFSQVKKRNLTRVVGVADFWGRKNFISDRKIFKAIAEDEGVSVENSSLRPVIDTKTSRPLYK